MYDELIKRLRNEAETERYLLPHSDNGTAVLLDEAADAIEDLEFACDHYEKDYKALCDYLPKWIPLTERLPEEHVFVLIRQDDNRMMVAERVDGDWWYRYCAYDVDSWDENEQGTITHWMPLPKPPKDGET